MILEALNPTVIIGLLIASFTAITIAFVINHNTKWRKKRDMEDSHWRREAQEARDKLWKALRQLKDQSEVQE